MRKTSIILLTYNNLEYTKACLESIYTYTEEGTYELIVIDNASTDGTREYLVNDSRLRVVFNEENVGFPKGCNQGIALSNPENDILLLNNDTIVTSNWLSNLKKCLYSDTKIGAVGPVCNQQENRQGVSFTYTDLNQMQTLALENNHSNQEKWEEKIFLIGYCLLIKREVINQLKKLDEAYTPGYVEDNDLSLRILKLGYKLILCHDTFIHHYLGTSFRKDLNTFYPILNKNRAYFKKKWGFSTLAFDERKSASYVMLEPCKSLLEINAGIGVSLKEIDYQIHPLRVEGVEYDKKRRAIASLSFPMHADLKSIKNTYDTILIGDFLETVKNPSAFLQKIHSLLKEEGTLLLEMHNMANIKTITSLLEEKFYKEEYSHHNFFTLNDMKHLLLKTGYKEMEVYSWYQNLTEEEERNLALLEKENSMYRYTYYTIRCKKNKRD
jgi:GT2 family glycosyltransferase